MSASAVVLSSDSRGVPRGRPGTGLILLPSASSVGDSCGLVKSGQYVSNNITAEAITRGCRRMSLGRCCWGCSTSVPGSNGNGFVTAGDPMAATGQKIPSPSHYSVYTMPRSDPLRDHHLQPLTLARKAHRNSPPSSGECEQNRFPRVRHVEGNTTVH
jgi:hypothetical protein